MDTLNIYPEPGNLKKIAKQLLEMADKASDVEYIMWPEQGFRVPVELGDRFVALSVTEEVPTAPEVVESEEPVKRKPGRPKKIQEGQ